jgi:hypothetical protein
MKELDVVFLLIATGHPLLGFTLCAIIVIAAAYVHAQIAKHLNPHNVKPRS